MALIDPQTLEIPPVSALLPKVRRRHDVKPCGTTAAYRRHFRRGENMDRACQQAEMRRLSDYKKRVKANGGKLGGRWPNGKNESN